MKDKRKAGTTPSPLAGDSLSWLEKCRLQSLEHRDYDWVFKFDGSADLVVHCLWRLLDAGRRIVITREDEGQRFGLPSPVEAVAEVIRRLAGARVERVQLRAGTLDLELAFGNGHILQVLPDSSGYEAWVATDHDKQFIATGGGEMAILSPGTRGAGDAPS